jgi:hypothetical protein
MNRIKAIQKLRKSTMFMSGLPDTISIPGRPGAADTVFPIENATLDELAQAKLAYDAEASEIYKKGDALRILCDRARKAGAVGADVVVDVLIRAREID